MKEACYVWKNYTSWSESEAMKKFSLERKHSISCEQSVKPLQQDVFRRKKEMRWLRWWRPGWYPLLWLSFSRSYERKRERERKRNRCRQKQWKENRNKVKHLRKLLLQRCCFPYNVLSIVCQTGFRWGGSCLFSFFLWQSLLLREIQHLLLISFSQSCCSSV